MPVELTPETLRPLPLRVTQRQYLRLVAHRSLDSLPIQEHVRRALDAYLDELDRKRPLERLQPVEKKTGDPAQPPPTLAPSIAKTSPKAKSPAAVPAPQKAARRAEKLAFR